jgi:hypothetical protein
MGAIHTATLNIPGGDCVNEFEQITIADTRAIPSMQDIPPDGIFLDWPFKSMHQTFRHVHIERSQGRQIRGNGAENVESATTENVSWSPDFSEALMDYGNIGVTSEFPAAFGGRAAPRAVPAPPQQLTASAPEWNRVTLQWQPPNHEFSCEPKYFVYRDAKKIAVTQRPQWNDISLNESTTHRYSIAVSDGEFAPLSESSSVCEIRTPLDRSSPRLVRAAVQRSAKRIRVVFDKPIDAVSAGRVENWTSKPPLRIQDVRPITATCVEITVDEMKEPTSYQISAKNVVDRTRSRNPVISDRWIPLKIAVGGVRYSMAQTENGDLLDESGGGHDACLHGTAVVEPMGGPGGTAALAIGNEGGYAEANANLDFGEGDFTLMAWIWKATPGSAVILSRGNGFGASDQWSWGWEKDGAPGSISLRANNRYFATAPDSVPLYRWVHVAFVRKGNTGQSYVNGSPSGDACDMAHVGSLANDQPLRIGRRSYEANPAYFRGRIASVRIVPLAVSPEEIRTEWEESKQ